MRRMKLRYALATLIATAALVSAPDRARAGPPDPPQAWSTFNGNLRAQKFSTAAQITPANVHRLAIAWQLHTGDVSKGHGKTPATAWSATPLFVNDTLYISTPYSRVFAVDPGSGAVKWTFDPHAPRKALTQQDLKSRGVAYWQAQRPIAGKDCQRIVYVGTVAGKLWAVDAGTGKPCEGFGRQGVVDIDRWNNQPGKFPLSLLQPPTVYKHLLIIGWCGQDWGFEVAPAGLVLALDAETGALEWTFHPLTPAMERKTGKANVWAGMSIDPEHGLLFVPTSPPSPDDYGGNRKQDIPYGNAVIALDADTGAVVWSRQLVHHDLWDYDITAAPTLVDLDRGGRRVPALVQTTKHGFIFVLNRLTGEPIYPIEEVPVPRSDVPGEQSAPTQPEERIPTPTTAARWPGVFTLANVLSLGNCSRRAARLRDEGRFTPPSLRGSLVYPATSGGMEWGGGAVDPTTGTFVVNSSNVVFVYRLIPRREYDARARGGPTSPYHPQAGAPYGVYLKPFVNWLGMPCWKPPYGTLSAYDLDSGDLLWREPFGRVRKLGLRLPRSWGSVTLGGPVITRSGLIFIGASMDSSVRAVDLKTGQVLWTACVDAPAVSIPAVYEYRGREYVVFTVGGNPLLTRRVSDQLVAFALP